jgi:hypothetical protein
MNPNSKEYKEFEKWQVKQPDHQPHGTDEDIRANLKRVKPRNWRMEGNELIADTDLGKLVQRIPVDYILTGEDASGLPVLEKINFDKQTSGVVK